MQLPIFIKAENQLINVAAIVHVTKIPAPAPSFGVVMEPMIDSLIIELTNGKLITLKDEYAQMAEEILDQYTLGSI